MLSNNQANRNLAQVREFSIRTGQPLWHPTPSLHHLLFYCPCWATQPLESQSLQQCCKRSRTTAKAACWFQHHKSQRSGFLRNCSSVCVSWWWKFSWRPFSSPCSWIWPLPLSWSWVSTQQPLFFVLQVFAEKIEQARNKGFHTISDLRLSSEKGPATSTGKGSDSSRCRWTSCVHD